MQTNEQASIEFKRLGEMQPSPTNPRKRFPEAEQAELTDSVRKHGVLQPLLVRPWPDDDTGLFEIVAGERRYRAANTAGLLEVPVLVRHLTDDEVLHIQIVENLQRKDLHPLEEADGYKVLSDRGHTLEQIAAEVSQTKTYIAQRLKLCALNASTRKLFYEDKLNARTALMIARLPTELQEKAAKTISTGYGGQPMSAQSASDYVQREFMLRLDQAPFKTADATLVPAAGACGPCPKRTGNQADLFGDVRSKELCTDPACYEKKRAAAAAQKRAEAEATGRAVITGKDAKQILPSQHSAMQGGFVNLDARCYEDPKQRTFRQIIGAKGVKAAALLESPHDGKLIDVMPKADLKKVLADKGIQAHSAGAANPSQSAENAKKKAADAYRGELFRQVRAKHLPAGGLDNFDLKVVAVTFYRRLWSENQKRITKLYGWGTKGISEAEFAKKVDEFEKNEPELLGRLVMDIALIDESVAAGYPTTKPELLEATARVRGIDPGAVRKQVEGDMKPKRPTPVPAKKTPADAPKPPAKAAAKKATPAKKAPAPKKTPAAKKVPAAKTYAGRVDPPQSTETRANDQADNARPTLKRKVSPPDPWPFPSGSRP